MTERRSWTPEEDRILKFLREQEKIKKWSQISRIMESSYKIFGRNQKQCRQRYQNHLNSTIVTQKLTQQEERELFQLHDQHGNKWSVIANNFPGRTDNSLKNHFHSKLRGAVRKINRYLGCRKKKNVKSYPLSIVYKIVKYFGQNRKQFIQGTECSLIRQLKNGLLKFAGANVNWQNSEGDDKNQKKMAEKIIYLLQRFEKIVKPVSRKRISYIESEERDENDNNMIKTQEALPQNRQRLEPQLFKTFSSGSIFQRKSSLKQSHGCPSPMRCRPIVLSHNSSIPNSISEEASYSLQFQKLELQKNQSSQLSNIDSDIRKLVQQKAIILKPILNKTSSASYSMIEMVDENQFKKSDSLISQNNGWIRELDGQMKLDSCIFQ